MLSAVIVMILKNTHRNFLQKELKTWCVYQGIHSWVTGEFHVGFDFQIVSIERFGVKFCLCRLVLRHKLRKFPWVSLI
jgi:hypothetical protein